MNYPGLKRLYESYRDQGFTIAAFPCNQFGGQAPGSSEEERAYAIRKFGLEDLLVFDKVEVNGPGTHPIYRALRAAQPGSASSQPASGGLLQLGEAGKIEWVRPGGAGRRRRPGGLEAARLSRVTTKPHYCQHPLHLRPPG